MRDKVSVWKSLNSVPKCLKNLLSAAGYDTFQSLTKFDEEKILEVEIFLNLNKSFVGKLSCCYSEYYKGLDTFKFLPGHKTLLKSIPTMIEEINKRPAAIRKATKNMKNLSKCGLTDDEFKGSLIKTLINGLKTAAMSRNVQINDDVVSTVNIVEFERASEDCNFICKAKLNCPFCSKSFLLKYKNFWTTSHVSKHLKEHVLD